MVNKIPKYESDCVEFKTILPPSNIISRLICGFANQKGGKVYIGINDNGEAVGIDKNIPVSSVINKALKQLKPIPIIETNFESIDGKQIIIIDVEKSEIPVQTIDGKMYRRVGETVILFSVDEISKLVKFTNTKLNNLRGKITSSLNVKTNSKKKFLEHIVVILKILDEQYSFIYSSSSNDMPKQLEGKLMSRLLFSSCVDTFEGYFSDILYEVYLAKPETLKSSQANVAVKEVLECDDIQDFIIFWSKKQISKLQRGSLKEFLSKHKQISAFTKLLNESNQLNQIEEIMQIRHLYSHRNGIIDDKFIQYVVGSYTLNSEHILSINDFCRNIEFLIDIVEKIDNQLISEFDLSID
jgi:hypothetical protein